MFFLAPKNFFENFIQFLLNLIFRIIFKFKKSKIKKKINIINGDSFENLKKKNEIFFFNLDNLKNLKKNIIKNKTLIFHNSDISFDQNHYKKILKFRPRKCFSQNMIINKKNFYNLPIGVENFNYYSDSVDINDLFKTKIFFNNKNNAIIYGFNSAHKIRKKFLNYLSGNDLCHYTNGWNKKIYWQIVSKYKFIFCPRGNGYDTHRIWEAMYLKTIPILIRDKFNSFYEKNNFPVFILDKIEHLDNINEIKLKNIYKKIYKKFANKKLFFSYWKNLIIK